MSSKLKGLVDLKNFLRYRFQYSADNDDSEFSLPSMVSHVKVKFVLGYRTKVTTQNSNCHFQVIPCVIEKFQLIVFCPVHKAITMNSPNRKFRSLRVF